MILKCNLFENGPLYRPNCQKFLSQSGLTFIILVSIKPGHCTATSDSPTSNYSYTKTSKVYWIRALLRKTFFCLQCTLINFGYRSVHGHTLSNNSMARRMRRPNQGGFAYKVAILKFQPYEIIYFVILWKNLIRPNLIFWLKDKTPDNYIFAMIVQYWKA